MSFGFGFGLPHRVAVLGGSSPPATVYFLSVTTATTTQPKSIVVDSSGNIELFGYNVTGNTGLAAKLTSSGTQSLFKGVDTAASGGTVGSIDSSDNIYITSRYDVGCGYYQGIIIKANTSFGVVASKFVDIGGGAAGGNPVIVDNSGNVWTAFNGGGGYLVKLNSTFSSGSTYLGYEACSIYVYPEKINLASSGNLIVGNTIYDYSICCCSGAPGPLIQSITTSGVLNWTQRIVMFAGYQGVTALAIDSSDNIYFTTSNVLIKLDSSGAVQWTSNAKQYTGIAGITDMALDSSGNVYCVGPSTAPNTLEIIKVNPSGVLQFSRKLSVISGGSILLDVTTPAITVKNGTMYIATATYNATLTSDLATVLKVPTDGTLTQNIVVGAVTYGYAAGTVTSNDLAITGALTTNYPFGSAIAAALSAYTPSISDVTATTAVTPL